MVAAKRSVRPGVAAVPGVSVGPASIALTRNALLEILGPAWIAALGSDMTLTALRFLARYANPVQVKRLGRPAWRRFSAAAAARHGQTNAPTQSSKPPRPRCGCGEQ